MSALPWFLVCLAALLLESALPGFFHFACLALGALGAALASLAGAADRVIWGTFVGITCLGLFGLAPLMRRWAAAIPDRPVGFDALAGQEGVIESEAGPCVRLDRGGLWLALLDQPLPPGTRVEVIEVKGTRLRVRPIGSHP
jgi:membrane protein implicated in regulation of membrane protease activity